MGIQQFLLNLKMRWKFGCRVRNPKISVKLFAVSAFCFGIAALAAILGRHPMIGLTYGGLAVLYFCISLKYHRLGRIRHSEMRHLEMRDLDKTGDR